MMCMSVPGVGDFTACVFLSLSLSLYVSWAYGPPSA